METNEKELQEEKVQEQTISKEEEIVKCKKCGEILEKNSKFCPSCGEKVEKEIVIEKKCRKCGTAFKENEKFCSNCGEKRGTTGSEDFSEEDIKNNKKIAILCYFGIFMLIPFLTRQNSNFIKYHSNQGLLLLIFSMASSFILIIPLLGWILGFVGMILSIVFFFMGVYNVLKGRVKPLPLIGKYQLIK